MLALTVESAKTIAIVAIAVLVLLALVLARLMATITQKAIALTLIAALVVAVWSQRQSLSDCATRIKVRAEEAVAAGNLPTGTTTCSFFGRDVTVTLPAA